MRNLSQKNDSYYSATRADMIKFINNTPKTILEIGCGEGNFSLNFSDVEYWGVEPNREMVLRAVNAGRRVLAGTYETISSEIPNGYFDLVACNDVIEHMIDPIGFLNDIKTKLKPTGKLIASIPNIRYAPLLYNLIFRGDFDYTESGLMDYTHLHFFTHKSFGKIAKLCGWNVELLQPLSIAPFKPFKELLLKLFERGNCDMRNVQFVVRLSPEVPHQSP